MAVTMKDIAKKTGISVSTISRVMTNQGYIKPETRAIIEKAAAELGYKHVPIRKNSQIWFWLLRATCQRKDILTIYTVLKTKSQSKK